MNLKIFNDVRLLLDDYGFSASALLAKRENRDALPSGIYFLFDGDEIVYVGRSITIMSRIETHSTTDCKITNCKVWDSFSYISCPESYQGVAEALFIAAFQPKYNSECKKLVAAKQEREK